MVDTSANSSPSRPSKRRIEDRYGPPTRRETTGSTRSTKIVPGTSANEIMNSSRETVETIEELHPPSHDEDVEMATAGNEGESRMSSSDVDSTDDVDDFPYGGEKKIKMSAKRLAVMLMFLLIFPVFPLALSAGLGGFLALVERAPFLQGFLYVASNLLNMATPLTDFNPVDVVGVIIDVYVSVIGLMTFGLVLNVVNVFQIPLYINQQIETCVSGRFIVPTIALGVVIPIYVSVVAVVFGAILGALEGWGVVDGILYVFSNLLGLGTPLVELIPESIIGDIIDIVISSLALGATAIVVDYVTVLNPARYVRKRLKETLTGLNVFDDDEPGIPNSHPLAYASEARERHSILRDVARRKAQTQD